MAKLTFATTGPSIYSENITDLVEDYFEGRELYITNNNQDDIKHWLDQSQAYIGAGGADIGVHLYGSEITSNDSLSKFCPLRDAREKFIIQYCLETNKPMLLICRNFQLIGSVFYKIPLMKDVNGSEICHSPGACKINTEGLPGVHFLYIRPEFQNEFGEKHYVGSAHHQSLYLDERSINFHKQNGLEILGYAHLNYNVDKKKELKIIEFMRGKSFYATQFHLEDGYESNSLYQTILEKFKALLPKI